MNNWVGKGETLTKYKGEKSVDNGLIMRVHGFFTRKEFAFLIYFCDEVMGSGKTTAAIKAINAAPVEQKFMFVTPYLSEVARIKEGCAEKEFCEPVEGFDCKTADLERLIDVQANIVTTHALFTMMPLEYLEKIRDAGYVLFLDEALEPMEPLTGIDPLDAEYVTDKLIRINEDSSVEWIASEKYHGQFTFLRNMCDKGYLRGAVSEEGAACFVHILPTAYFTSFKDVVIMTYLFSGQILKNYLNIEKLPYRRLFLNYEEQTFTSKREGVFRRDYRPLITILDNPRMNAIGDKKTALSHSWYARNDLKQVSNNLNNFFKNMMKSPANSRLWTVFADCKEEVGGSRYSKSFLACNTRATNEYKDRTVLAYLVNRYRNPFFVRYFRYYGVETNNDIFALSEMLQWLWRSALRDGKHIILYIPSKRMRDLLKAWLGFMAGDVSAGTDDVGEWLTEQETISEQMVDFEEEDFYE